MSDIKINLVNVGSVVITTTGQLFSTISWKFQFLQLLVKGHTAKTTGKLLNVSPRTIEKHFKN